MNRKFTATFLLIAGFSSLAGAEPKVAAPATQPTLQEQMKQLRELQEAVQTRLLAVPDDDRKRLAEFLKQPDAGLIKLLPREMYDRVLHIRGGGAYYSFVLKDHEYGHGSDIELQNNRLSCGFAGGDYGYFLPLGDVTIQKAATVVEAAAPDWAPDDAKARWAEFWQAVPVDHQELMQRRVAMAERDPEGFMGGVAAEADRTFLLRSVSPSRSDILVAFRVERACKEDGSILISWKALKKFPVVDRAKQMRERAERAQQERVNELKRRRDEAAKRRQNDQIE